jgi:phosphatidylglycerophosphate synthase
LSFDSIFFSLYFSVASIVRRVSSDAFRTTSRKEGKAMRLQPDGTIKTLIAVVALVLMVIGQFLWAQNLGSAPASNVAVQGQSGAQPEGAFLNFINWVGNVIAPVGAGGAVFGAVVSWLTGRGFGRWLFAAAALLAISGVTRLIEFWITNGTGGVT